MVPGKTFPWLERANIYAYLASGPLHAADGPSFFAPVNRLWFSEA
jgi:NDP-sugar pyrophosphorylase family protein